MTEPTPAAPYREHLNRKLVDRHLARVQATLAEFRESLAERDKAAGEWPTEVVLCAVATVNSRHEVTISVPSPGRVDISVLPAGGHAALERRVESLRRERRAQAATIVELRDALDTAQRAPWIAEQDRDKAWAAADLSARKVTALQHRMDAERAAAWQPRVYQSRPLTPEQERSVELNECRADWPAMIAPCDPIVVFDDETVLVACATDGSTIVELVPARSWSALVAAVVAHRCNPARPSDGGSACCGGADCAGKCGEVCDAGAA